MDSEDDMHDANDVDSYEEDYYSGDDMYSDDDDDGDAGYEFLDNDSDDSDDVLVRRQQKNYTILKEDDICQRQEDDITRICSVLSISRDSACMLLRRYNWNVSNVHEAWFANEGKVRKAVGLLDKRILSHQRPGSCLVGSALNRIHLIRSVQLPVAILFVIHVGQPTLAHLSMTVLDV